jgi:hypothetical protein
MVRHLVHATGAALLTMVGLAIVAGRGEAQTPALSPNGIFDDPFTFYYAYYLPNQQLQAMRPSALDPVNNAMIQRQYFAQQSDRRSLYNPISPYSDQGSDPLQPFSARGNERRARPHVFAQEPAAGTGANPGPALYFNRPTTYFPGLAHHPGRGSNANVYARSGRGGGLRGGRGAVGGMGMGGMGNMGMGGMGGSMGMPGMGMF